LNGGVCSNWSNSCFRRRSFWTFGLGGEYDATFAESAELFRDSIISLADFACRRTFVGTSDVESNSKADNRRRRVEVSSLVADSKLSSATGCEELNTTEDTGFGSMCLIKPLLLSSLAEVHVQFDFSALSA